MPLLTYRFIDTFPVNINAVPMSYDGSTILQVTVVFTYLRHTVEKHGNLQQSVREKVYNSQLTQVNPTIPRRFGNEIRTSVSTSGPQELKGYVNGKPYYGSFHVHPDTGVKMVGAEHSSYPHEIIYDTMAESLPASASYTVTTDGAPSGDDDQQQEQQQQQEDNQQQQQQEDNQQQQEDNQQQQQQQDNNNNQQQQNQGGGGYGGGY